MEELNQPSEGLSRRTVMKGAAWSVPVLALAVATPMAAASGTTPVNDVSVDGDCALLGVLFPGFTVSAPTSAIPAGSQLVISFTGLLDLSLVNFGLQGGLTSVASLSVVGSSYVITFNADFSGNGAIRTLAAVTVAGTINANLVLPDGYEAGTGAKLSGALDYTSGLAGLLTCSDS